MLTSVVCSTVPLPSGFTFTSVVLFRHAVSVTVAISTARIRIERIQAPPAGLINDTRQMNEGHGQDGAGHRRLVRDRQGVCRAAGRKGLRAGADRAAPRSARRAGGRVAPAPRRRRRTPSSPTSREPDASSRIAAELRNARLTIDCPREQRRLWRARQLRQRGVARSRALHAGDGDGGARSDLPPVARRCSSAAGAASSTSRRWPAWCRRRPATRSTARRRRS